MEVTGKLHSPLVLTTEEKPQETIGKKKKKMGSP
jgi:hypothetical protein